MSDWWSRKLAGEGQAPAPRNPGSYPAPPPPPAPAPPRPVTVPQQHAPAGQVVQLDADHVNVAATLAQHTDVIPDKAIGNKTETAQCPGCGGYNYFSRSQGVVRGPAPAPSCFDCGYPLVQAGSGLGSLGGSAGSGSSTPARQSGGGGWNPQVIVGRVG